MYTGASISIYQYKRTTVQWGTKVLVDKKKLKEPIRKQIINKIVEVDIEVEVRMDSFKSPSQSNHSILVYLLFVLFSLVKSIFTLLITISVN